MPARKAAASSVDLVSPSYPAGDADLHDKFLESKVQAKVVAELTVPGPSLASASDSNEQPPSHPGPGRKLVADSSDAHGDDQTTTATGAGWRPGEGLSEAFEAVQGEFSELTLRIVGSRGGRVVGGGASGRPVTTDPAFKPRSGLKSGLPHVEQEKVEQELVEATTKLIQKIALAGARQPLTPVFQGDQAAPTKEKPAAGKPAKAPATKRVLKRQRPTLRTARATLLKDSDFDLNDETVVRGVSLMG